MKQEEKSVLLQNGWISFNSNMGSLYTFFENIKVTADKLDEEKKKKLSAELVPLLGGTPEEIEKEVFQFMPSIDYMDILPDIRDDVSAKDTVKMLQDSKIKSKLLAWENKHPHKSQKLARVLLSLYNNPPVSGIILRKSMLITLVTFLEVLIEGVFINHNLIQGFARNDAIIQSSRLMKGTWNQRLNNLSSLGIPPPVFSLYRTEILEIVQLRNLLVHNDGMVDEEYLKRRLKEDGSRLKVGNILIVSTERLQRALDVIFTYGVMLNQYFWRQNEETPKQPDIKFDQLILAAFDEKRYSLILEITDKIQCLDMPDLSRQRLLVDRAIAFRALGNINEVNAIVNKLANAEHDWQIEVAIAMLRRDYTKLYAQLRKAQMSPDFLKMAHWPLFDPIKNEIWFKTAFVRRRVDLPRSRRKHA